VRVLGDFAAFFDQYSQLRHKNMMIVSKRSSDSRNHKEEQAEKKILLLPQKIFA